MPETRPHVLMWDAERGRRDRASSWRQGGCSAMLARMGRLIGIAKRSASGAPMEELDRAGLAVERGVADDLRGKVGRRQVTVLSKEAWAEACRELGDEILLEPVAG